MNFKINNPIKNNIQNTYETNINELYNTNESKTSNNKVPEANREYNPYSKFTGLNPINKQFNTESKFLNKEIESINKDKDTKENYYKDVLQQSKIEVNQQKSIQKKDHIKKIFSTLNFPLKPTSYNETFEYSTEKKTNTIDHSFDNHYKKSFMKTYEENKIMHQIILRK